MWMALFFALSPFKPTFAWSTIALTIGFWVMETGAPVQGMLLGLAAVLAALVPFAQLYVRDREGLRDNKRLQGTLDRLTQRYDSELAALHQKYDEALSRGLEGQNYFKKGDHS